ncbi:MAG: alpha/beta hydrolase [Pseudonocardia sp.]|nr:alpha/beta hydrolase [Pseudonocardia sp.]
MKILKHSLVRGAAAVLGVALTLTLCTGVAHAATSPTIPVPPIPPIPGLPGAVQAADPSGPESPSGATCHAYYFPVKMSPGDSRKYKVWGQLCTQRALDATQPVQVLIHGGSYNHTYWDWPYQPDKYSYVSAATKKGFATLNVDRLGNGYSDHPPSVALNFRVAGYVVHQLVQYLRKGALGPSFQTVVLNGHSMGGLTAQHEASEYRDVNAVITTGVGHRFLGFQPLATAVYPSELDSKFGLAKFGLLPGYLTTIPGKRTQIFVGSGKYDPAISKYEEANKDVVSTTELTAITADSYDPSITRGITAPVLFALGQHDLLWCPTALTEDCYTYPGMKNEHSFYNPATRFTSYVVPGAAHSVNMNTTNTLFYDKTFDWLHSLGIQ